MNWSDRQCLYLLENGLAYLPSTEVLAPRKNYEYTIDQDYVHEAQQMRFGNRGVGCEF